ncbi:hypothetical protein DM860_001003 [Cuscuta australis]|uniref:Uncharacterized protein n=1 Tax=Cuscuta australis TaxID=267555 RepID=A0A328DX51_9ASTE|nr:hypothetical protein DM860_001003 [Cuscuta australis]
MANMVITTILEKMTGKDKDYRYMETSDLLNELNKEGFKLDAELEAKAVFLKRPLNIAGGWSFIFPKAISKWHINISLEVDVMELLEPVREARCHVQFWKLQDLYFDDTTLSSTIASKVYMDIAIDEVEVLRIQFRQCSDYVAKFFMFGPISRFSLNR